MVYITTSTNVSTLDLATCATRIDSSILWKTITMRNKRKLEVDTHGCATNAYVQGISQNAALTLAEDELVTWVMEEASFNDTISEIEKVVDLRPRD